MRFDRGANAGVHLLALRCVNTFYSKRVKAVKIFPPLWNAISAFSFCGLYDI